MYGRDFLLGKVVTAYRIDACISIYKTPKSGIKTIFYYIPIKTTLLLRPTANKSDIFRNKRTLINLRRKPISSD